jgi:predicted ATP-dependent endonuclease of OLD family
MWRMLAMAIAITQCKGGVLLVDEIDTGLHYSVMSRMWGLIYKTAEKLDVQVFATTHSQDCVRSIAELCQQEEESKAISIHRIEKDRGESVRYSPTEIVAAAENNVEMR